MESETKHLDYFLSTPRPGSAAAAQGHGPLWLLPTQHLFLLIATETFCPFFLACGIKGMWPQWLLGVGTSFPFSALGWVCDLGTATQGMPPPDLGIDP